MSLHPFSEQTEWCAPIVVVPKSNNQGRICVDLKQLNKAVLRERHILPSVDHTLEKLTGAKVFSKLNANSGFHKIPLSEKSECLAVWSFRVQANTIQNHIRRIAFVGSRGPVGRAEDQRSKGLGFDFRHWS